MVRTMTTTTFDTLAFAKKLKAAGFTEEQAETLAHAQAEVIDERLVTREHLDNRLQALEYRLTIKLGTMIAVGVGFLAAIKLFS